MTDAADNAAHEQSFVDAFITKAYRERLSFELHKRRAAFLNRFCHEALLYLAPQYVNELPPSNSNPAAIYEELKRRGAKKTCSAISMSDDLDGRILPLKDALSIAVGFGLPSILSCLPGELVYLETEQEAGPPQRFILSRDRTA